MAEDENLNDAILSWSRNRPHWEQTALGMLARDSTIDAETLERLADDAEAQAAGTGTPTAPLASTDLGPSGAASDPVRILAIREPHAVNALNYDEGITFEPQGLTLIYGSNGSGKSGYARVLKTITRSREHVEVLGDIFAPVTEQSAEVSIDVGGASRSLSWPTDSTDALRRVSFYDSGCAGRYVSSETEVAYRPWAITLLDKLVGISGQVRAVLERRRDATRLDPLAVPGADPSTRAGQFLRSLSATTTQLEIDVATEVPSDAEERLAGLRERIASLRSNDPEARKTALQQTIAAATTIEDAVAAGLHQVSERQVEALRAAAQHATQTRATAARASELRFQNEPLPGTGDPVWAALWESARRFSTGSAYPGQTFPHLHDDEGPARCVLCQQVLDEGTQSRLERFEQFVTDDTEEAATAAERQRSQHAAQFTNSVAGATPVALARQRFESDGPANQQIGNAIAVIESRRAAIVDALSGGEWPAPEAPLAPLDALSDAKRKAEGQLEDLLGQDTSQQAAVLEADELELAGRLALRGALDQIAERVRLLKARSRLDEAIRLTNTQGVTRRAADLTRSHVSDVMKHRFSQETLLLGLKRVRLGDAGGGQGNLRHRAQFVDAQQRAAVEAVLSEGEQTALGLAGFLTEVEGDTTRSAVVFDDPVTSLDHVRQEKVAERLVQLAGTRQVVVFTHDIGFVVDLKRAAEIPDVAVAERHVSRHQDRPGHVSSTGPWDGLNVRQRLNELDAAIAQIREITDPDERASKIRHWYQDLRLLWERSLEEAVIDKVTNRIKLELRPGGLKSLVQITNEDNRIYQAAFTRCGDRGSHDRSTQLNRTVPSIEELREDLESLRTWHKRVKAYD